jgi:hypothetical protein
VAHDLRGGDGIQIEHVMRHAANREPFEGAYSLILSIRARYPTQNYSKMA